MSTPTPSTPSDQPRTVLITGATGGLGLATAQALSAGGWRVLLGGRDRGRAEQAAAQIPGAEPVQLDVNDPVSVAAAVAHVESLGQLDALINNAGIQPDYGKPLLEVDLATLRAAYETNVFAVVALTNALLPALRRAPAAQIINISSGTGSFGWSTGSNPQFDHEAVARSGGSLAVYRSSKAALNFLTLIYAQALQDDGIRVTAVAPGRRATNLNPTIGGDDPAEAARGIAALLEGPAAAGSSGRLVSWDGSPAPW